MKKAPKLTAERLREVLRYDPETGVFTWRVTLSNTGQAGSRAGHLNAALGYVLIKIDHYLYRANRLAWLYVNGAWPSNDIDHINRVKHDDRYVNLREATNTENMQNRGKQVNNTSGHKGVYMPKGERRWMAYITHNRRMLNLGRFDTVEQAVEARKAAEAKYHPFAPKETAHA